MMRTISRLALAHGRALATLDRRLAAAAIAEGIAMLGAARRTMSRTRSPPRSCATVCTDRDKSAWDNFCGHSFGAFALK